GRRWDAASVGATSSDAGSSGELASFALMRRPQAELLRASVPDPHRSTGVATPESARARSARSGRRRPHPRELSGWARGESWWDPAPSGQYGKRIPIALPCRSARAPPTEGVARHRSKGRCPTVERCGMRPTPTDVVYRECPRPPRNDDGDPAE